MSLFRTMRQYAMTSGTPENLGLPLYTADQRPLLDLGPAAFAKVTEQSAAWRLTVVHPVRSARPVD